MRNQPQIHEHDLELVANVLAVINPGHASTRAAHPRTTSADYIRRWIETEWPFDNISTGGWVAYAEDPAHNDVVRVALTPYSVDLYLRNQAEQRPEPATPHRAHDTLVRRFLDLSTDHVRPSTEEALRQMDMGTVLFGKFGFMVHIAIKDMNFVERLPVEMQIIVHVARVKYPGVAYALFDRDGPLNPDFPTYTAMGRSTCGDEW